MSCRLDLPAPLGEFVAEFVAEFVRLGADPTETRSQLPDHVDE